MTRTQVRKQFTPIVSTLALFVVWEAACWAFQIPTFILPRPTEALAALIDNWPGIWPNALHTLITTLIGFGAAVAVGMMLGIAVGTSALVYDAINPLLIGFNAIPKVALVPILVLWFGIGTVPAVITAFLTAFFPIVVNVATGIATVEPELSDVLRSLGASKTDIVRKVGIPRSMPYFFASLKIARPRPVRPLAAEHLPRRADPQYRGRRDAQEGRRRPSRHSPPRSRPWPRQASLRRREATFAKREPPWAEGRRRPLMRPR